MKDFLDNKIVFRLLFFIYLFISPFFAAMAKGSDLKAEIEKYTTPKWKLSQTQKKYLLEHIVISDATVETKNEQQSFALKAMALHKKKCYRALRKLSRLEDYSNLIDFIKTSTYNDKSQLFTLHADHPLLPYPMIIHIIVKRPKKQGHYVFSFPTGMFRGLTGHFDIKQIKNKCLFYAESFWRGSPTKIPDFAIEIFSETLSQIAGKILMRKSQ